LKLPYGGSVSTRSTPSRKTSKRTRIETKKSALAICRYALREKHPREQGLKHSGTPKWTAGNLFEKNIQENKD